MATQQLVFLAVPGGIRSVSGVRKARISVFVSPRLHLDGTSLKGDFLNWPQCLRDKRPAFEVKFGNLSRPAAIVNQDRPELWSELFNDTTFVRPHTPDATSGVVGSYPTARLHDLIKNIYQDVFAGSPLDPPTDPLPPALAPLRQLFDPAPKDFDDGATGSGDAARARLAREIFRPSSAGALRAKLNQLVDLAGEDARSRQGGAVVPPSSEIIPDLDDPAIDLARFLLFHRQAPGATPPAFAEPEDTRIDFHQQLANLGEYPALQRRLGLIIDLDVDIAGIPLTGAGHGLLRVIPTFATALSPPAEFLSSDTAYTLTETIFRPAPGGPPPREIVDGLLNLSLTIGPNSTTPQFRLVQVDVDAGGFDVLALLRQAAAGGSLQSGLATLRSGGVSIARYGNAASSWMPSASG